MIQQRPTARVVDEYAVVLRELQRCGHLFYGNGRGDVKRSQPIFSLSHSSPHWRDARLHDGRGAPGKLCLRYLSGLLFHLLNFGLVAD